MPAPKARKKSKLHSLYLWHRYIGLMAALLVILLAVTGILLNHTHRLHLDAHHIQAKWLLRWYGIPLPEPVSYRITGVYISQLGDFLYLDQQRIAEQAGALQGVVRTSDGLWLAAYAEKILLFTPQGELIEKLDAASGVPSGIMQVGLSSQGEVLVRTHSGNLHQAQAELLGWQLSQDHDPIHWATTSPTPAPLRDHLAQDYRGTGLSWERLLLDVHSGRIWGAWGVYMMDFAALLLLLLAGSGVWIWGIRRFRGRK